jgi:hypothetical protein
LLPKQVNRSLSCVALSRCGNWIIPGHQHYQFLIRPTERRKARRTIFNRNSNHYAELTASGDYA